MESQPPHWRDEDQQRWYASWAAYDAATAKASAGERALQVHAEVLELHRILTL